MASPSTRSVGSSCRPSRRLISPRIAAAPVVLVIALLRVYRLVVSPFFGSACRFAPSCSRYAEEAVSRHGLGAGLRLTLARIARCHPWSPGGYDPVPQSREA